MATLAQLANIWRGSRGGFGGSRNTGGPGGMSAGGPGGTYTGAVSTGGAEPFPTGSSTTGRVGTTMQPNGYIPPGVPPGTGGIKPPPGSVGTPDIGYLTPDALNLPTNPAWFSSPQGLAQQMDLARRVMGPYAGLAPNRQPHAPVVPGSGPTQGYTSPMDAYRGMRGAERSAAFEAANAGQPRTWYAKELANAGVNWQGMNDMQQMRAYLNTLPPEKAQAYLSQMAAAGPGMGSLTMGGWQPGMDPMMPVGQVGSGPFGV